MGQWSLLLARRNRRFSTHAASTRIGANNESQNQPVGQPIGICSQLPLGDPAQLDHQWPGLTAIGKVVRVRETAAKTTIETAYYLLRTAVSPDRFNEVVRSHWGVENQLHWRLDVVMNEDQDRTRLGNGPNNLAVLRHMALNVMQKDPTKGSLRGKLKRAGWDDAYLSTLIALF